MCEFCVREAELETITCHCGKSKPANKKMCGKCVKEQLKIANSAVHELASEFLFSGSSQALFALEAATDYLRELEKEDE